MTSDERGAPEREAVARIIRERALKGGGVRLFPAEPTESDYAAADRILAALAPRAEPPEVAEAERGERPQSVVSSDTTGCPVPAAGQEEGDHGGGSVRRFPPDGATSGAATRESAGGLPANCDDDHRGWTVTIGLGALAALVRDAFEARAARATSAPAAPHDGVDESKETGDIEAWLRQHVRAPATPPARGGEPTAADVLALMERTDPKDWPSPRGYGYQGREGKRIKTWQLYVMREFARRATRTEERG